MIRTQRGILLSERQVRARYSEQEAKEIVDNAVRIIRDGRLYFKIYLSEEVVETRNETAD